MHRVEDGQILRVEVVDTSAQRATVAAHHTWEVHLHASYTAGVLRVECRYPAIEGTEWQGQIILTESRDLLLSVDGSEPITLTVAAGVSLTPLVFEAVGTYRLHITATYGCVPAVLEVTV